MISKYLNMNNNENMKTFEMSFVHEKSFRKKCFLKIQVVSFFYFSQTKKSKKRQFCVQKKGLGTD